MYELRAVLAAVQGAQMAVLVGDQKQLPPTVKTQRAAELGLEAPLFSRLIAMGTQPHLLDVQYRMHPAISQFPSEAFYRGLLRDGISPQQRVPPAGFPWPDPSRPVAFLECRCDLHGASQVSNVGLLASAGYNIRVWSLEALPPMLLHSQCQRCATPLIAELRLAPVTQAVSTRRACVQWARASSGLCSRGRLVEVMVQ